MVIYVLIVFLFATIRTLVPLADVKNHSLGSWFLFITTIVAYVYLVMESVTIKM